MRTSSFETAVRLSIAGNFRKQYEQADIIISKGQGNFETLDHRDGRVFFIFKAKCPVVADYAGCKLNDMVIKTFTELKDRGNE